MSPICGWWTAADGSGPGIFTLRPVRLSLIALALIPFLVVATPATGLPGYAGDDFEAMFQEVAAQIGSVEDPLPPITGRPEVDTLIEEIASRLGYQRRPLAAADLVRVDGHLLTADTARAWQRLRAQARAEGVEMRLVSGWRSLSDQRITFLSGLSGSSAAAIESRLRWSAPPGYSKHHTGLAIDLASGPGDHNSFGRSAAYRWLAADNYRNAKRFGFIPSYPPDATPVGPNPEPWEWVYVGIETIFCGTNTVRPPTTPIWCSAVDGDPLSPSAVD